jgi:GT2 family glycosyltransferase
MNNISPLALVTVTYNSENVLEDFFNSLLTDPRLPKIKLYLVDNASADKTLEVASRYKDRIDISIQANDENLGVAVGNNQGISAALSAGAEWILLVNNDTIIPAGTLAGLLETATEQRLHILSPTIEGTEPVESVWYAGGTMSPYQGMKVRHEKMGSPIVGAPRGLRRTPYASTCCLLIHRDVINLIGGMDKDYFVYFDDVDFAIRAKSAGFPYWLTGEYKIIHKASSLTGGYLSPFSVRWISRNWVLVTRKHCSTVQKLTAFAYMQLWMFARVAARRDTVAHYKLRQRSFLEGLKVPITRHGAFIGLG